MQLDIGTMQTISAFGKGLLRTVLNTVPDGPTGTALYEASVVKSDDSSIKGRGSGFHLSSHSNYSLARPRFFRLCPDRLYYWEKKEDAQNWKLNFGLNPPRGFYSLRNLVAVSTQSGFYDRGEVDIKI